MRGGVGLFVWVWVFCVAVCSPSITYPFGCLSPPALAARHESPTTFTWILVVLIVEEIAVARNS